MKACGVSLPRAETVDEAVAILAEVAGEDGRCWPAGRASCRPWRFASPSRRISSTSIGVAALNRLTVADGKLVIGAGVRHAAFHRAGLRRAARRIARRRGAAHRALSDPQPRHLLRPRSRMPIRRQNGAGARRARRRGAGKSVRGERVIAARDFFKGIMTRRSRRMNC